MELATTRWRKPGRRRRADDIRPCGIVNGGGEPPPYMVKNGLHIGKREQREGSDGMIISKDAGVDGALELNPQELAQINAWSRRELTAEEVYAFAVKLCDNEVDRDWERFPAATLEELAPSLRARAACSTTSGAPGSRPPVSTAPRWCGRRGLPGRGSPTAT